MVRISGNRPRRRSALRRTIAAGTLVPGIVLAISAVPAVGRVRAAGAGSIRTVTFRMIRGRPFVTATFDGGRDADFAVAAEGAACTVRSELAAWIWAETDGVPDTEVTITIGDAVLRHVRCEIGTTNSVVPSRLGWDVEFDYAARELLLRHAPRNGTETGPPRAR